MLTNRLGNSAFSTKEMMLVLLIIFAGFAYGLYKIIGNNDITRMAKFKRQANSFVDDAGRLRDGEILFDKVVYLYDVVKLNYNTEVLSPFDNGESCDLYESKIEMEDRKIYLTFKCSEYYIYNQSTTEEYTVFKASAWTEEKIIGDNVQTTKFYNYKVDGKEILEDYYIEKEFLVKYSIKSGYKTNILENIKEGHELVEKTYYRTLEEVK